MAARPKPPRVFLRPVSASDRREFLDLMACSRALHRGVSQAWNDARFDAFLQRSRRDDVEVLLLCRSEDDAIVGYFALSQIFRGGFQNAYLGYVVGQPFAGQGYMTEGMRLVLHHAFRKLRLHRLEANIQPTNARSIALVKRCGFRLEGYSPRYLKISGRWRDHERWAITREDWSS